MTLHHFHNPGTLDLAFLTQFGLSIKSNENAIGQFGTGLKYAFATILRNGGRVTLRTAGRVLTFSTREMCIKGTIAHIITANPTDAPSFDLPFSTTLGKNWQPWMAFRELYTNALDEGGGYSTNFDMATLGKDTLITVHWPEWDTLDLDHYFLRTPFMGPPLCACSSASIYTNQGDHVGQVYYKGIRVSEVQTQFTIVLTGPTWQGQLTEDRTITDGFQLYASIRTALYKHPNAVALWRLLEEKSEMTLMQGLDVPHEQRVAFCNAVLAGVLQSPIAKERMREYSAAFPPKLRTPTPHEQAALDIALAHLARGGVHITYPIQISTRPFRGVLGEASGSCIYIEASTFDKGLRTLIKTLLEEWTHLETGAIDETYAMQHALHENWINLYSHLTGEYI